MDYHIAGRTREGKQEGRRVLDPVGCLFWKSTLLGQTSDFIRGRKLVRVVATGSQAMPGVVAGVQHAERSPAGWGRPWRRQLRRLRGRQTISPEGRAKQPSRAECLVTITSASTTDNLWLISFHLCLHLLPSSDDFWANLWASLLPGKTFRWKPNSLLISASVREPFLKTRFYVKGFIVP